MDSENRPSLPDAHQQVRLGDNQASAQRWLAAIEHYSRAIGYFTAIQNTLRDANLKSIIQAQIVQCEKTIHLYRLKDRFEQADKAQTSWKMTRAHSIANIKPTVKINRTVARHSALQLQNPTGPDGQDRTDSLTAMFFPNHYRNIRPNPPKNPSPIMAKKTKDDSEKMEELQMGYEAMKDHLKAAYDDIDRLKNENNALRVRGETSNSSEQVVFGLLPTNHDDGDEQNQQRSDNELEATI